MFELSSSLLVYVVQLGKLATYVYSLGPRA